MKPDLRRDYFWNTLGVFLQNAISPFLIIVITRINGIYDSGLFSFAFAVAIIFWAIGMWGGRTYQTSDVKGEFSLQSYIVVRLLLAGAVLVGGLIFAVANQYDIVKTLIIMALVLFKVIESIADALYGVLQARSKLYISGISLTYKAVLSLAAFIAIDLMTHSILLGCMGIVAINIFFVLFYDLPNVRKVADVHIGAKSITQYYQESLTIIARCTPVFLVMFLAMFSLNIPRYFIDRYYPDEIGYFGILAMPVTLLVLVISFILQPNIVRLSGLLHNHKRAEFAAIVNKLSLLILAIGVTIFALTYVIGVPVLNWFFGLNFSDYKTALMVLIFGAILNAFVAVLINILTIMRSIKPQFYVLCITNVLLVVVAASLIQSHGLMGAMWLFTATGAVQIILLSIIYGIVLRSKHGKD